MQNQLIAADVAKSLICDTRASAWGNVQVDAAKDLTVAGSCSELPQNKYNETTIIRAKSKTDYESAQLSSLTLVFWRIIRISRTENFPHTYVTFNTAQHFTLIQRSLALQVWVSLHFLKMKVFQITAPSDTRW